MSDEEPQVGAQSVGGRLVARCRRILKKLEEWDGAGGEPDSGEQSGRLHRWLPAAIVLVSLGAAAMGWQASIADERATHADELSRQELVLQQQVSLQKVQEVDSDLRLFGELERYSLLAGALEREARLVGTQERPILAREATRDNEMAQSFEAQLQYPSAVKNNAYNVEWALKEARSGDPDLSSLEPTRLRLQARFLRNRGLHLVGLAVLFIVSLVFFTFAAVTSGRRQHNGDLPATPRSGTLAQWVKGPEASSYWFAGCGIAIAAATLVLFAVVRWV